MSFVVRCSRLHARFARPSSGRIAAVAFILVLVRPDSALTLLRSAPQGPLGTPSPGDNYTAGAARACVDGSGRFAVAYVRVPGLSDELKLQRFDAFGMKDGAPILLAGGAAQSSGTFDIACALDGEIVVAWDAFSDGDGLGIFAQVFDAAGATLTGIFQVNAQTSDHQRYPRVAVSDADELLFAWGDRHDTIPVAEAHVRLFDLAGSALSAEHVVQAVTGIQDPDVTALSSGGYAVVWTDVTTGSILMRQVTALGMPTGSPVTIGAAGGGFSDENEDPWLVRLPGGGFLAGWLETVFPNTRQVLQRFDDDGTVAGAKLLLPPTAQPLVGATADDGFVIVTTSYWDGHSTGLLAQRYDATDTLVADPFTFNIGRLGIQQPSSLAVSGDGDFLATWFDTSLPDGAVVSSRDHVAFVCAGADPTCDPCLGLGTADSDGDGLPDECDPCTRSTGSPTQTLLEKSDLQLRKILYRRYGQNRMKLKARFLLPPTLAFSDLDLVNEGMLVVVSSPGRSNIVDSEPHPGLFDKSTGFGWNRTTDGRKYRYRDRESVTTGGITGVTLFDRGGGASGGEVHLKLTAKQSFYPFTLADTTAEFIVRLGDTTASLDGRCAEAEFDLSECEVVEEQTVLGPDATSLRCRER